MTTPDDPHRGSHDDDLLAARLRAALTSEADMVNPSDDGLQNIRSGIDASGRPWWRHPATPALAAAVVLAVMVGGIAVFALGGDDKPVTAATDPTSTPTTSQSPSPTPSPSESDTPLPIEGDVYVYYVMDDGQGPRLYREQRPNPGMGPVDAALATLFNEAPLDPQYQSPWPAGTTVLDLSTSGDTATLDVSGFPKLGAQAEEVAVQQLVYTVTANDKAVKKVRLLVDGKTPASGHTDLSQPLARAPMIDVQGWIWLLSPTEGASVSSPVDFTGYGTAFEATISWQLRQDGKVVDEGTVMGGSNGEFGEFAGSLGDLPAGTYELRAFESSAKDGSPQHVDTKTFTVK